jgi:hypothetical protein
MERFVSSPIVSASSWGSRVMGTLVALALGLSGCNEPQAASPALTGEPADVRVTEVVLGPAVGLDKRVTAATEVFGPEDTVHVSVVTEGRSSSTLLGARWKRDGRVLEETRLHIAPAGSATSEFHVAKPGGFERGDYEVEILLEGRTVEKRRFSVK